MLQRGLFFLSCCKLHLVKQLTKTEQDTCIYGGIFGIMLGCTCLIQLFVITRQHWISAALIIATILTMMAFLLLVLQKYYAPLTLVISGGVVLINNAVIILLGVVSLINIIYLAYIVAIITVLLMGQYAQKLRAVALAKKEEENEWRGKI